MTQYSALAAVYDKLNGGIDYVRWADYIEAVFDKCLPARPELVLDLACGTGAMTIELARRGYDMTGIDASPDMLSEAQRKSSEIGNILYLCQDMTSFELYGTVGAIVCCLDGINYLTDTESLRRCFSLARNYLDPGGLFIFDVNTPFKFENIFGSSTYVYDEKDVYCVWRNYYNDKKGICRFALDIFERCGDGRWRRRYETQTEKCWSRRTLEKTLTETGFETVLFTGGYDFNPPAPDAQRWHIAAKAIK